METLDLYRTATRARAFELALAELWQRGRISGEMHLGTGEEAIAAGVAAHLRAGDAVALDHRPTPMLVALGVDLVRLLREMLGSPDGLCRGRGGHMHLFSREHLAASSGIVGAAGPLGAGFALAAKRLRPGALAVAFFGDGAANQGMLMESMNLAVAWKLPLLFVCKDNGWAITTRSEAMTGGALTERARAFGLEADSADGGDLAAIHDAAGRAVARVRRNGGPFFLHASCPRLDGHFLGDPMVRMAKHPVSDGAETFGKVVAAAVSPRGGSVAARASGVVHLLDSLRHARLADREGRGDPLVRARRALADRRADLERIDGEVAAEVDGAVAAALGGEAA